MNPNPPVPGSEGDDGREFDPNRPAVLIVEDDADLRHSLVTWLQQARNYTVLPARDGEEARLWAQQEDLRIDVAVIDLVLPDSFGSQVAFDQTFARPDIKTIYMSGHVPDDEVLAASVKDRNSVFLQKPFELAELGKAIDEALGIDDGGVEGGSADGGESGSDQGAGSASGGDPEKTAAE